MTEHVFTGVAGRCLRCGVASQDAHRVLCVRRKSRASLHRVKPIRTRPIMDEEELLACVRKSLASRLSVREIKMFGGVGFMLNGNLLVAASSRGLLVRVGKEAESEALRRPGASPMVMRGRVMGGYLRIESDALDPRTVAFWIQLARRYVEVLPTKRMKRPTPERKRRPAARSR